LALGSGYELGRELGCGGMSRVFMAEDARLGRSIVAKVLASERHRRRFMTKSREATHPNADSFPKGTSGPALRAFAAGACDR
jgi:hypothetical protein